MAMLKTRKGWDVNPDLVINNIFEAIGRAEYARPEDAHKDIIKALSNIAYLLDAVETKVSGRKPASPY